MSRCIVSLAITLFFTFILSAQEEGAPVKLTLSGKYFAPKSNYVISGSTETGTIGSNSNREIIFLT